MLSGRSSTSLQRVLALLSVLVCIIALLASPGKGAAATGDGASTPTITGRLTILWGDAPPGQTETRGPLFMLNLDDGSAMELRLPPSQSADLAALLDMNRRRVVVTTAALPWIAAPGTPPVLDVQSIRLAADEMASPQPLAITGSQPWVSIMCKFADYAAEPRTLTYFRGMFSNVFPRVDHYWRQASYDIANVGGSTAFGWYVLPQPRSYYVSSSTGLNHNLAARDCTAVADPTVDFRPFIGINLMFNYELDGYAWGGGWYGALDGVTKVWSMTWEPPWGYAHLSVIEHEMGHGFGLPHSKDPGGYVYGNPWDVMSNAWYNCSYNSDPTYGCIGQGTIAYHKDRLGWIAPSKKFIPALNTRTTITLERLALPLSSNYLMAQIPIAGSSSHFYSVEARHLAGYDVKVPRSAVVVHEIYYGTARLVAYYGYGVGEVFSDATNKISVTVNSATDSGFVVTIVNGTPPGYIQRVNAGGPAYIDSSGNMWAADRAYAVGAWGYLGGGISTTSAPIAGTNDDPLYQSQRWWSATANPGYKFNVPNGTYQVTLRFSEPSCTTAGCRRFNVRIQGTPVLGNFDIFAQAGGKDRALDKVFTTNVSDGKLIITFIKLDGLRAPVVNAIAVKQIGP